MTHHGGRPAFCVWLSASLLPGVQERLGLLDDCEGCGDLLLGVGGQAIARDEADQAINSDVQPVVTVWQYSLRKLGPDCTLSKAEKPILLSASTPAPPP